VTVIAAGPANVQNDVEEDTVSLELDITDKDGEYIVFSVKPVIDLVIALVPVYGVDGAPGIDIE
jgi:hypothetical protein